MSGIIIIFFYLKLEESSSRFGSQTRKTYHHSIDEVRNILEDMNASLLEDLIPEGLRTSFDRILVRLLEEKEGIRLKPAREVGMALDYSSDSIRTLISRGKFIAVKRGKEWLAHENLLLKQGKRL